MSESGHAIVVWFDGIDIRARLRSPSGLWSAQRTVDTGCSPVAVRMFGVDRSVVLGSCGGSLRLLRSGAAGGFFEVGETPEGLGTRLAINSLGGALVATAALSEDNILNISHAAPDMPLTAPLTVTTSLVSPSIGSTFDVALDSAERGHVIYTDFEGVSRLKGRELDGNALTLTPPVVLDRGTGSAYYPTLSGTSDGSAIVAWNQSGANPEEIWANIFR
jgi:hypothetical protein